MKKFLSTLTALICLTACAFSFTACDNDNHTHNWIAFYFPDGDRHYQTCSSCDERLYSDHEFDADGYCECGADNLHHHKWQEIYILDSENGSHYQTCEGCEEKRYSEHEYENGVCKLCNKEALIYQLNDNGTYTVTTDDSNYLITEITIPAEYNGKPVTAIADEVFRDCRRLKSVTISDGITTIGKYAFYMCRQLTTVTIPNSVTTIGNSAFDGCALTSITLPDKLTAIGDSVFSGCDFTNITIPKSVTSIGFGAFDGCINLTNIILPDTLTYIGGSAFDFCKSLTSIVIPDRVSVIGTYTFSGCDNLTTITLPETIIDIGRGAFKNCTNLTNITFKGTKEQWNKIGKGAEYGEDWNKNTGEYTIHCTDGDIVKNQTEQ